MTSVAPRLATRTAHWGYEEHRYFGSAVFGELRGRESFAGLMALSVLGRRLPEKACALLDEAAICLTMADPRIWPLKLTRLVAAYGHAMPAVAAGLLIQEEARIGPWAMLKAAETLVALECEIGAHADDAAHVERILLSYVQAQAFMWGFGTPFRARDERLVAFRKSVEHHGCLGRPYFRIFEALAEVVKAERRAPPNMGMAVAAVLLDQGLTPREIGPMTVALMQHMFFAQAVEGAEQAPDCLRKLPSEFVHYIGKEARRSPRSQAQDS
jgi:hypothetical protein